MTPVSNRFHIAAALVCALIVGAAYADTIYLPQVAGGTAPLTYRLPDGAACNPSGVAVATDAAGQTFLACQLRRGGSGVAVFRADGAALQAVYVSGTFAGVPSIDTVRGCVLVPQIGDDGGVRVVDCVMIAGWQHG